MLWESAWKTQEFTKGLHTELKRIPFLGWNIRVRKFDMLNNPKLQSKTQVFTVILHLVHGASKVGRGTQSGFSGVGYQQPSTNSMAFNKLVKQIC